MTFRSLFCCALLAATAFAQADDLLVRAELIHTAAGDPVSHGAILIRDGKIVRVGREDRMRLPDNITVLEAEVVTPGFVDIRTTDGISGVYGGRSGQVRDQDQLETSDPVQPELRPIDAYNAADPLIDWVRQFGVTTMHTGHGPGAVISGGTMIVKTTGDTVEEAVVATDTAVAITLGPSISDNFESPGTRSKTVALLRSALIEAAEYAEKRNSKAPPGRDLKKEMLARVLAGDTVAMIRAHSRQDIITALRLRDEFGFELWLDGASDAYLMTDLLKEADVPVLLHPPMMRAGGETRNASFAAAAVLQEAGIRYAIQTGHEGYVPKSRVLLFEATIAVVNGLAAEDAIIAITRTPAELLGIDDRVGTIEKGKEADLVLFNGDPFEYRTQVCGVIVAGEPVSETCW